MEEILVEDLGPPRYKLGSGEFGRVFESDYRGHPVVCKMMKHAVHASVFENELDVLHSLQGVPNIPRTYGYARCPDRHTLALVMQRAPGVSLYNYVCYTDISFLGRLYLAKNVCMTLSALHDRFVLYRDMKPDNIVVDPRTHRHFLVDFGLSVRCASADERVYGMAGTPGYMAPEVCRDEAYGQSADVYSLGMTFYFLFTNHEPERMSVVRPHLARSRLPWDLQRLLLECLTANPDKRPTSTDVGHRLSSLYARFHPVYHRRNKKKLSWWRRFRRFFSCAREE